MTIDTAHQLRQWLEERRDKAAGKVRNLPNAAGVVNAALSAKATAEYFFAMDALDKLKELESK